MEFNDIDDYDENRINGPDEKLDIRKFELNDKKRKSTQIFFHYVLDSVITKYNLLNKQKREESGIYFMKDKENNFILLADFKDKYIYEFLKYNELFANLMVKNETSFYPAKASKYSSSTKNEHSSNRSNISHHSHNTYDNYQNRGELNTSD